MGWWFFARSSYSGEGISRDHAPSVGNGPGAMALNRMRYFAHSTASERVIASTPAFAHADGTTYPEPDPTPAYVVAMFSTLPPRPAAIHLRPRASVQWNVP